LTCWAICSQELLPGLRTRIKPPLPPLLQPQQLSHSKRSSNPVNRLA
jgi:hypothetical protein